MKTYPECSKHNPDRDIPAFEKWAEDTDTLKGDRHKAMRMAWEACAAHYESTIRSMMADIAKINKFFGKQLEFSEYAYKINCKSAKEARAIAKKYEVEETA